MCEAKFDGYFWQLVLLFAQILKSSFEDGKHLNTLFGSLSFLSTSAALCWAKYRKSTTLLNN